ncbi:MAG: hypothetical protein ABUS57_04260 [Pseudomonadota bacterium]
MKRMMGAAIAVLMFATVASAQPAATTPATPAPPATPVAVPPSQCPATIAAPAVPDGATIAPAQMEVSNNALKEWAGAMRAVLDCRRAEFEAANATAIARRDEFNGMAESLNTTIHGWEAATAVYCARPHMRCTNENQATGARQAPAH